MGGEGYFKKSKFASGMEKLSNTNIPILGQIAAAAQASNAEEDVVDDLPRRD